MHDPLRLLAFIGSRSLARAAPNVATEAISSPKLRLGQFSAKADFVASAPSALSLHRAAEAHRSR